MYSLNYDRCEHLQSMNIYVDICDKAAAVWFYDFTRSPTFLSENEGSSCVTAPRGQAVAARPRVTPLTHIVLHDQAEPSLPSEGGGFI